MTTQLPTPTTNGHDHSAPEVAPDGVHTYRGRSVEELIPQIRAELGPNAVILRQREGLVGGVGGFFAQRCVEVDARIGGPGIDVYDDDSDAEPTFAGELELQLVAEPKPFADAEPLAEPESEPVADGPSDPEPPPVRPRTQRRASKRTKREEQPSARELPEPPVAVRQAPRAQPMPAERPRVDYAGGSHVVERLCELGASEAWARALLTQGAVHSSPFAAEGNLTGAVLDTLTRSLPQAPPLPLGGGAIAFVGAGGSGKTSCAAGLAAAYRRAGSLQVTAIAIGGRDGGRTLTELLEPLGVKVAAFAAAHDAVEMVTEARATGLVIVDTAAPRPGDIDEIEAFAAELETLELDAVALALPATIGAKTAQRLLAAMEPVGCNAIALTHVDETDQLGAALELSCTSTLPIAYLHEGVDIAGSLSAPHPAQLAARVL